MLKKDKNILWWGHESNVYYWGMSPLCYPYTTPQLAPAGLEPAYTDYEPVVLPLNYRALKYVEKWT